MTYLYICLICFANQGGGHLFSFVCIKFFDFLLTQAQTADKSLAKGMFLPLAERMTEKYAKEDKIEAEAEVQLYVMVLEMLEKYNAGLELLSGPLGGTTSLLYFILC